MLDSLAVWGSARWVGRSCGPALALRRLALGLRGTLGCHETLSRITDCRMSARKCVPGATSVVLAATALSAWQRLASSWALDSGITSAPG
jgi:hypothetical protein